MRRGLLSLLRLKVAVPVRSQDLMACLTRCGTCIAEVVSRHITMILRAYMLELQMAPIMAWMIKFTKGCGSLRMMS